MRWLCQGLFVPADASASVDGRIVGIGASAGGIEALKGFLENMRPDSGMGFVVVLHLSANHKSLLAEVLGRWTRMPVTQATDGAAVLANRVYVAPPDVTMRIENRHLRLTPSQSVLRGHAPIDGFFASLAADQGSSAVGVVLSGTGSDGALGLKAIKQAGGMTMAQGGNGSQPQHAAMPAAAIATGAVDLILPVEAMPERIASLPEAPALEGVASIDDVPRIVAVKPRICAILRAQIGHDFSGYKEQTFMRRVFRRMQLLGLDADAYVERLGGDPVEVALLFRDLLIGVTSFFRDPDIFQAVEQTVIPLLFQGKDADNPVRVWVPGCATGEEAYSLGILLREHMMRLPALPKVQIFATDIDDSAIAVARTGRYPAAMLQGLSRERRDRFFNGSDGSYVVAKEVRDLCTFSAHSVIRDPPFSRTDMISCRNLLIYLDTDLQAWVIPAFHYALRQGGFLLLGGSEAVTRHGELFIPLDKKHRIFRRRDSVASPLPLTGTGPLGRLTAPLPAREPANPRSRAARSANQVVLDRFSPAFVVVNDDFDVLHFSSRTGRYLEAPTGSPTNNLVTLARRGLKLDLRAALREAVETGRSVQRPRVEVELDSGNVQPVTISVERLPEDESERLLLVVFSDAPAARRLDDEARDTQAKDARDGVVDHLEREVRDGREQLQSIAEEYETALEELKSANEELNSVNEELQSTNEELETSKEEIQSVNEELQTVNAQLNSKVNELDRNNSDLRNLFESTQVATIFLDRFLVVRGFTPAVGGIYNLIPSDQGRPLSDIASQIDYATLREDVRHVLDSLQPLERRVTRLDGQVHYLMRILPYRAADDTIDGALITFVDVSSMVQAERHHRLLVDELNHRVRNMLTVVISLATQTLRGSLSLDVFSHAFLGRLHALAGTYAVLSRHNWQLVLLRDVMEEELRPHMSVGPANVDLEGPSVFLEPRAALAMGMTVHELATNARRYGALTAPNGQVAVKWRLEGPIEQSKLVWTWQELGGPPPTPAAKRGFGSTLIERTVTHDLNGTVDFNFAAEGLAVTLSFSLMPTTRTSLPGLPPPPP